jgi:hypothetical protein
MSIWPGSMLTHPPTSPVSRTSVRSQRRQPIRRRETISFASSIMLPLPPGRAVAARSTGRSSSLRSSAMDAVLQPACCGRRASPSKKPSRPCNGRGARLARLASRALARPACPAERPRQRVHRRERRCSNRLCILSRADIRLRRRATLLTLARGRASMAVPGSGQPDLLPNSPALSTAAARISRRRLPRRSCWLRPVSGSKAGAWPARRLRDHHPVQPRGPIPCALPPSSLPPRGGRPIIRGVNPFSIRSPRARARQARPVPSRPCERRTARLPLRRYGPTRRHRQPSAQPRLHRLLAGPFSTMARRPRLRRAAVIRPARRPLSVAKRLAKPCDLRPSLGHNPTTHWEGNRPVDPSRNGARNGTSLHRAPPGARTPSSSTTAIRRVRPILIPTMPPGPTRLLPLRARLAVRGCRRLPAPGNGAPSSFRLLRFRTRSRAG